jgi:hypothetical protein
MNGEPPDGIVKAVHQLWSVYPDFCPLHGVYACESNIIVIYHATPNIIFKTDKDRTPHRTHFCLTCRRAETVSFSVVKAKTNSNCSTPK